MAGHRSTGRAKERAIAGEGNLPGQASTRLPAVVPVGSAVVVAATIAHALACYRLGSGLDTISGVLAALADDLNRGTLYRPLLGPLGWGGTRDFPLYFALHALALRCGVDMILAGYVLSALAGVLTVLGTYVLLRQLEVRRGAAAAAALWVLAPLAAQRALGSFHPDLLAAGLSTYGAALCLKGEKRREVMLGALFFALAFASKMTAIAGVAAVVAYWISTRRSRAAGQLVSWLAVFCGAAVGAMQIASGGRAWEVLLAAGGTSARSLLLSGPSFLQVLLYDPVLPAFIVLALFAFLTVRSERLRFPKILFLCTLAVTILIYAAPGASTNHLLELQVAAIVLMAVAVDGGHSRVLATTASAVVIFGSLLTLNGIRRLPPDLGEIRTALRTAGKTSGPILAENPMVPLLAGQRPRVLDPFMINLLRRRHPKMWTALQDALARHAFAAVILDHDPDTAPARAWYNSTEFGPGFVEELQRGYLRVPSAGRLVVFKPRSREK